MITDSRPSVVLLGRAASWPWILGTHYLTCHSWIWLWLVLLFRTISWMLYSPSSHLPTFTTWKPVYTHTHAFASGQDISSPRPTFHFWSRPFRSQGLASSFVLSMSNSLLDPFPLTPLCWFVQPPICHITLEYLFILFSLCGSVFSFGQWLHKIQFFFCWWAGDWPLGLVRARQTLYHWAVSPAD